MSYPSNWKITSLTQDIVIGPSFAIQHTAVVCGVVIGSYPTSGKSFDLAANDLALWLRKQTPDVVELVDSGYLSLNGTNVRSFFLTATSLLKDGSGQKQNERDWIIAIPHGNASSVDWMVFVSPERDFDLLEPTFDRMLQSFKPY